MSSNKSLTARIGAALKELFAPAGTYSEYQSSWYLGDIRYGSSIDYRQEAGDLSANSIVQACVGWICTTFPEAPLGVQRPGKNGPEPIYGHELVERVNMPNDYYSGQDLWDATLSALNIDGNGYWIALLNGSGRAVELWYEPNFSIRPVGSTSELISKWQVQRRNVWIDLDPATQRVIHFREGIDPNDQRRGLSDLLAAYREVATDNEAARYTYTLMRNLAMPGVIISPKGDSVVPNPDKIKTDFMNKFTGDRRGEPMVMTKATDVYRLDFSPAEMDMGALRAIPEERISALLGVPAIVAGLGAGLDTATYSNFQQAERKGWTDNILPTQRRLALTLQNRLLPLVGGRPGETVYFDTSQVAALQDNADALYTRAQIGYDSGFLRLNEARRMTKWEPLPEGDVFKGQGTMLPEAPIPSKRLLVPGYSAKALPAEKALTTRQLERQFRTAVQGWVEGILRQALGDVPSKALAIRRNGNGKHEELV